MIDRLRRRMRAVLLAFVFLSTAVGCHRIVGTEPPPEGWANAAPTVVEQVVNRGDDQLLAVRQGELQAWIKVPAVGADVGDFVLLSQGAPRYDVPIPELGLTAPVVVDIDRVQVVDEATAVRTVAAQIPKEAIPIAQIYAELETRANQPVVVYGTVVKAPSAVGFTWVHLQDGTGDASLGTHDLTVQTRQTVVRGQRVAFRGVLRQDVDLGFGYHYNALVEDGVLHE